MGKYYDVIGGIKLALERFRDRQVLKWTGLMLAVGIVGALLLVVAVVAGISMMAGSPAVGLLVALGGGLLALVALVYASIYAEIRLERACMAASGVKTAKEPVSVPDMFVLSIHLLVVNALCWYDRKLATPAAVLLVLTILTALAGFAFKPLFVLAIVFGFLFVIAWAIAAAVQGLRTTFARYMFLRGDGPRGKMPRASNTLVQGQTLELFLPFLVAGVVLGVIGFVLDLVARIPLYVGLFGNMTTGSPDALPSFGALAIAGIAIYILVKLAWAFLETAYFGVFSTDVFKHFDNAGPAAPAKAKKK
ncbi:MAG: hypothetical protein KGH63_00640 [Candidatus Micrarchaeota archaeon]|nr:hypothetical protein [Candidatus Micrarchaeota archaeon]